MTLSLVVIVTLLSTILLSEQIYVSKNGSDISGCGSNLTISCGTIFFASIEITFINITSPEIYIYDGQNELMLLHWINTGISGLHNPCLPLVHFSDSFTITFNPQTIKSMNDWYPMLCNNNISYSNEAFFVSNSNLTLNNLIINNYTFDQSNTNINP
eukprot:164680_1